MRRHAFIALLLVGGCTFDQSGIAFNDGSINPNIDARVTDGPVIVPDARSNDASCGWSYVPRLFDPCDPATPSPSPGLVLDLAGLYVYNTDSATLTDPNQSVTVPASSSLAGGRALWVQSLFVASGVTLRFEGSVPAIVISFDNISIQGTIEVNSYWDGVAGAFIRGAGANPDACPVSPPNTGQECAQHAGSGGGAGAFGGAGGPGGEGGDGHDCGGGVLGIAGGAGGVALGAPPVSIRGGCSGRDGSTTTAGGTAGDGAPGGGALYMTAATTLTINGTVHAGGAGGGGGQTNRSGGGGGGSGGMLGLEAQMLVVGATGVVASNGGGGGGGSDNGVASEGQDGQAGDTQATGGPGQGNNGGVGGKGGAGATVNGEPGGLGGRGGGGGGGGVGFILMYSPQTPTTTGATISPDPVIN